MNTIMCIMNLINGMPCVCQIAFIRYFIFWTFASLNFGCTRSKFCMHTHDKHVQHPMHRFAFQNNGSSAGWG